MSIALARQAARKITRDAGLSLPVDLEELALWRGLTIELADDWQEVLCARYFSGERRIVVNSRHMLERRRFSVAHEIGHFVLGHDQVDVDHGIDSIFGNEEESYALTIDVEREANAFATELLMPRAWVKHQAELQSDGSELIRIICRSCSVSRQAAWYRIMELKVGPFAKGPRRTR